MQDYQSQFIELSLEKGALKFGTFKLKSGRISPYFFNAGAFDSGRDLAILGECYARALLDSGVEFDLLFGPAYKGIPLVCATAMALSQNHGLNLPWCFNRKERKDHGEGGALVGASLQGRIVLVDDVITAGTALRESAALIKESGARLCASLIALDRMEKGQGEKSAIQEAEESLGIRVISIISFIDLESWLANTPELESVRPQMRAYRERYGVS